MARFATSAVQMAAPILTGLLLLLSYPPYNLAGLAWIALTPMMAVWRGRGPGRSSVAIGTLLGGAVWGGGIFYPLLFVEDGSLLERVVGFLVVTLLLTAFLTTFAALYRTCVVGHNTSVVRTGLIAPALWVGLEYALRAGAVGFSPYLGITQWETSFGLALAPYGGVHAVSGVLVGVNAIALHAVAWLRLAPPDVERRIRSLPRLHKARGVATAGVGLLFATVLLGNTLFFDLETPDGGSLESIAVIADDGGPSGGYTAVMIQPGFTPADYRRALQLGQAGQEALLARALELSRAAVQDVERTEPILVVWPETTLHVAALSNSTMKAAVVAFAREEGLSLLLGLPRLASEPGGARNGGEVGAPFEYNSAHVVTPSGEVRETYDKVYVIPVAESQYRAGRRIAPVNPFLDGAGGLLGVGICSDVVDPRHARTAVRAGAKSLHYLAALSRIGSLARLQRAFLSFRAAENGVFVTQTATTGPTLVVDPDGRTVAEQGANVEASLVARIPAHQGAGTPYTRWGDWPVIVAAVLLVGVGTIEVWSSRRNRGMLYV